MEVRFTGQFDESPYAGKRRFVSKILEWFGFRALLSQASPHAPEIVYRIQRTLLHHFLVEYWSARDTYIVSAVFELALRD